MHTVGRPDVILKEKSITSMVDCGMHGRHVGQLQEVVSRCDRRCKQSGDGIGSESLDVNTGSQQEYVFRLRKNKTIFCASNGDGSTSRKKSPETYLKEVSARHSDQKIDDVHHQLRPIYGNQVGYVFAQRRIHGHDVRHSQQMNLVDDLTPGLGGKGLLLLHVESKTGNSQHNLNPLNPLIALMSL